ncbi:MAG: type 4a pilus biogenesis protein PilO [Candidatus Brennerbacteria bacterium]|nr:type 4a pilus biogenesis protein PilO [Candidatus Brennerbacteria bacterium]
MKSSTKRILSMLSSALLFIASIVVYSNSIRPVYEDIKKLRGEAAIKQQTLDDQDNAVKQVQGLIREFESISQLQDKISLFLPLEENVPKSLVQFDSLSRISGVSIESIAPQYIVADSGVKKKEGLSSVIKSVGKIKFVLKILGSYEGSKNFIKGLGESIRIFDISDFKIDQQKDSNGELVSIIMSLDNYYQTQ